MNEIKTRVWMQPNFLQIILSWFIIAISEKLKECGPGVRRNFPFPRSIKLRLSPEDLGFILHSRKLHNLPSPKEKCRNSTPIVIFNPHLKGLLMRSIWIKFYKVIYFLKKEKKYLLTDSVCHQSIVVWHAQYAIRIFKG